MSDNPRMVQVLKCGACATTFAVDPGDEWPACPQCHAEGRALEVEHAAKIELLADEHLALFREHARRVRASEWRKTAASLQRSAHAAKHQYEVGDLVHNEVAESKGFLSGAVAAAALVRAGLMMLDHCFDSELGMALRSRPVFQHEGTCRALLKALAPSELRAVLLSLDRSDVENFDATLAQWREAGRPGLCDMEDGK